MNEYTTAQPIYNRANFEMLERGGSSNLTNTSAHSEATPDTTRSMARINLEFR